MTFSNSSQNPDTSPRHVTVTVNDGDTNSNTATTTINVTAANDPVQILASEARYWSNTGSGAVTYINRVSFLDLDIAAAVVVHATFAAAAGDAFSATAGAGVTVVSGNNTQSITIAGTIPAINAWLANNGLAWDPSGNPGTAPDRQITVSIDNNGALADGETATLNFTLDHQTQSFTNNADNVNFTGLNLNQSGATDLVNTGNGSDTVVTSWSHGPQTQAVEYNGGENGGDNDSITLVFTSDQIEEILSNMTYRSALQTYLDGDVTGRSSISAHHRGMRL